MNNSSNQRIAGKIIIHATLTNISPVLIGKGEGELTDVEIMRLPNGQPYIPGSSIAGCLQQQFITQIIKNEPLNNVDHTADMFWGSESKKDDKINTWQSHISFDDLITTNQTAKDKIVVRDGVRINHQNNIAEPKGKYDYELLEPEVTFYLRAEVTIREGMDEKKFEEYVGYLLYILNNDFRIGAYTNTGFGKMECNAEAWSFDFAKMADQLAWFTYLDALHAQPVLNEQYFIIKPEGKTLVALEIQANSIFHISANFKLKSALIIGAYGLKDEDADKTHLKSNKEYVLTGKSIRGALRHRALKILKTLNIMEADEKINDLFGYVIYKSEEKEQLKSNKENIKPEAKKGRLLIEEEVVTGADAMIQNRNKKDRFTGGTINTALFNSEPIWQKNNEAKVNINVYLNEYSDWEAALIIQLLKDLWVADLPIGGEKNVGRGLLAGNDAVINSNGSKITITSNPDPAKTLSISGDDTSKLSSISKSWQTFIADNKNNNDAQ